MDQRRKNIIVETYRISQLRREFAMTSRALRFYEQRGLLCPEREGLTRVYGRRERARLQLIARGRQVGLSVREIKEILDAYDRDGVAAQNAKAVEILRLRLRSLEADQANGERAIELLKGAVQRLTAEL